MSKFSCSENLETHFSLQVAIQGGDVCSVHIFQYLFYSFCMRVLYFVAVWFYFFSILMTGLFFFSCSSASCFLSLWSNLFLLFIQCRNADLIKWRTPVVMSVGIRIIAWRIIGVGVWVTIFSSWFVVWLSSSTTFLHLFILSRSKHIRWSNWDNTLNCVVVSVCYKAHFHNQLRRALSWSLISHRNMKENNGNYCGWKDIKSKSYYQIGPE